MSGDFCVLQNQFIPVYLFYSSSSSHLPRASTRHPTPTQEKHNIDSKTHLISLALPLTSYSLYSLSHCSQMSLIRFSPPALLPPNSLNSSISLVSHMAVVAVSSPSFSSSLMLSCLCSINTVHSFSMFCLLPSPTHIYSLLLVWSYYYPLHLLSLSITQSIHLPISQVLSMAHCARWVQ